jgi:signal transduction histidine kinase
MVEAVVAEYREAHPEATIEVDVPAGCDVASGDELRTAVSELVENALVHADGVAHVEVTAVERGDSVTLRVVDDGPGIPEPDRSVVSREVDIDQLTHSQGLGLWFVRWVMDACDGQLRLESTDGGTTVALELPRART